MIGARVVTSCRKISLTGWNPKGYIVDASIIMFFGEQSLAVNVRDAYHVGYVNSPVCNPL